MSDFESAANQKETKLRASLSEWEEKLLHLRNEVHRYQCDKRSQEVLLSVQTTEWEWRKRMAARSAALKIKTKLEEFLRIQKDAFSAEVKIIIEKARSDLQELVDDKRCMLQLE